MPFIIKAHSLAAKNVSVCFVEERVMCWVLFSILNIGLCSQGREGGDSRSDAGADGNGSEQDGSNGSGETVGVGEGKHI